MKPLLTLLLLLQLSAPVQAISPQPRIVGGTLSPPTEWSYMSALMQRQFAVTVAGQSFQSQYLIGSPTDLFSGTLVNCAQGFTPCTAAAGKICLIERGETLFYDKALNCAAGGGIAALIYNNVAGVYSGTLGEGGATIPVLSLSRADGLTLLSYLGQTLTLGYSDTPPHSAFCGATYLGSNWVVTAAHCMKDKPAESLIVNVGGHDLTRDQTNLIRVGEIIVHPSYRPGANRFDIALLRLSEQPVGVLPVSLADAGITARANQLGAVTTMLGRGHQSPLNPFESSAGTISVTELYQVELQLITNAECNSLTEAYFQPLGFTSMQEVTDDMLCAGIPSGGVGGCFGDSGGPLIYQEGGVDYLIGITSWGYGCAEPGLYDVFSRVGYFEAQIRAILAGTAHQFTASSGPTSFQSGGSSGGGGLLQPIWLLLCWLLVRYRPHGTGDRGYTQTPWKCSFPRGEKPPSSGSLGLQRISVPRMGTGRDYLSASGSFMAGIT